MIRIQSWGMRRLFWLLLVILQTPAVVAQGEEYIINTRSINVEDGLSHRNTFAIHQDSLGFIWIGTAYGLNRYDGYEFQRFTTASHGLLSNNIQAIIEDSEGFFWLMDWGDYFQEKPLKHVHLFHPFTHETISFEQKFGAQSPFQPDEIHRISVLPDKRLMFHGLKDQHWTYHPRSGFLPMNWPASFNLVRWISTAEIWGMLPGSGLVKINESGKILSRIQLANPNPVSDVIWQKNGQDSSLWILQPLFRSNPGALSVWQNGSIRDAFPYTQSGFLGPRNTGKFNLRTSDQTIWYVEGIFLWIISPDGKILYGDPEAPENLTSKRIHQIFYDRQGLTWFVTAEGITLMRFEKNLFSRYGNKGNPIWAPVNGAPGTRGILEFKDQLLFNRYVYSSHIDLKTGQGYDQYEDLPPFDNKVLRRTNSPNRVGGPRIPLLRDHQGRLWTAAEGLLLLDESGKEQVPFPLRQGRKNCWSLYEDDHHTIWMGLNKGLAYFHPEKQDSIQLFTQWNGFEELEEAHIIFFYEEAPDKIWLCTSKGLYILDPQQGIQARYGDMESGDLYLPANNFHHIYQDSHEVYWICTQNSGLLRWAPHAEQASQKIRTFSQEEGLPDRELYAVFEDQFNHLWISSANGLIHYNKETHSIRTYFQEDGITNNEFNRASYFQSEDGRIYFGSIDGITAFHPENFYQDLSYRQPLRLSSFQQYDGQAQLLLDKTRQLMQEDAIVLNPSDRFFSLRISLMDYLFSPKIQYEYWIDGLEQGWQNMRDNELAISGLPYGGYTLRLRARGVDGRYSTHQLDFPLIVKKPFYLTTGFLVGMVVFVILLVWFSVRLRTRRLIQRQKLLEAQVEERTRKIAEDKKIIEQQAEELRELDRLKSRFFTNISHEFRTPLTVMLGMVAQINENPVRWLGKGLELIKRNGNQLLDLINQIMDLRKLESQSLSPMYQHGDIIPYLRYILESFQSAGHYKNISLSFTCDIKKLEMDYDAEKLLRIINNLLSNAIKFTPEGGKISLKVSGSEFRVPSTPGSPKPETRNSLLITVSDTGIGIAPEKLPFIFGRFYQADEASKQAGEGTGIGLSLVKELVELLGGEIQVTSELEKGSQFVISLPITHNAPEAPEGFKPLEKAIIPPQLEIAEAPENKERHSVLIVEDNLDVQGYLQALLADSYQVYLADDGQVGIEKALELIPDLIISDVMMPHVDGFELCQRLKLDERSSHIPIVMLTARADIESRISGWERGADAYLAKPFDQKELATVLKKLLELRKTLQARYQQLYEQAPSPDKGVQMEDAFILKLKDTILNYQEAQPLNVSILCELLGLSRTQLHNKTKSLTGRSTTDFIRFVRLEEAKKLLLETDLQIAEIAYQVGFNEPAYFTRRFSELYGHSPKTVRKKG